MNKKILKLIVTSILLIYIFIYILSFNGYYEYNLYNQKVNVNNAINDFDKKVIDSKITHNNNYIGETDYSNKLTNYVGHKSIVINKHLKKFLKSSFKVVNSLFN